MCQRISRRKLLATTAASLSLAGCIQTTAKQSWKDQDAYPDDENRNRDCEIRSSGPTSGKVEATPTELGYRPFAYTLSGRGDMHGTNQHYNLTITADSDIEIIGTSIDDPVNSVLGSDSSTFNRPDDSDIIEEQTLSKEETYQEMWQVPDGETHTVLIIPDGEMDGSITVEMDIGCSYYLPLEEYKNQTE
jgi:hypothetical protein